MPRRQTERERERDVQCTRSELNRIDSRFMLNKQALKHHRCPCPGNFSCRQVQEKRLVVIEHGEAELWLPEADGERFVGLSGPTKVPHGDGWLALRRGPWLM